MRKTVESKVAKTILQKRGDIKIGDETYKVAPPTTATLILASEAISHLPKIDLDNDKIATESLYIAKDCRSIGELIAILILGAKGLFEVKKTTKLVEKKILGGLFVRDEEVEVKTVINHKAELAKKLLEEMTPKELNDLMVHLLQFMELGDFFGLTTSLIGINLLRKTRGVETTASGR